MKTFLSKDGQIGLQAQTDKEAETLTKLYAREHLHLVCKALDYTHRRPALYLGVSLVRWTRAKTQRFDRDKKLAKGQCWACLSKKGHTEWCARGRRERKAR